jgi:hypothetical protein
MFSIPSAHRADLLTLPPFPPAERYLTLDQLEYMQLKHRVRHAKDAFQDCRAFVLNKHPDSMRPMLGQLLHDLGKIDCREEVSPGEVSHVLNLVLECLAIG